MLRRLLFSSRCHVAVAVMTMMMMMMVGSSSAASPVLRDAFNERAKAYLDADVHDVGQIGAYTDLARLLLGFPELINGSNIRESLRDMRDRKDCSDFAVSAMIRMLWEGENSGIDKTLYNEMKEGVLNWQFWVDEANIAGGYFQGGMMFWTENHQFSFHSSEYLAGSLFPDTVFPGTNMTGAQHKAKGKKFVEEWLERRFRWGFSEFKSEVYYIFDVQNLANLAALPIDDDIRERSKMVLDLILYDLVMHQHKGMIASGRGRSYGADKFSITTQSVAPVIHLLTGHGYSFPGAGSCIVVALTAVGKGSQQGVSSSSSSYIVPDALLAIAAANPEEMENRERISINPSETEIAEATGLGYSHADDGLVWWGDGAYANPETFKLAWVMGDTWDLYKSNETTWKYFGYARLLANTSVPHWLAVHAWPLTQGATLGAVYHYMYRTPDVSLAGAMDYNKARVGMQQHAWQATLNGSVMVFTTQSGPNTSKLAGDYVELLKNHIVLESEAMSTTSSSSSSPSSSWKDLVARAKEHVAQIAENSVAAVEDAMDALLRAWVSIATAPSTLGDEHDADYADGHWSGSASMPRVGQYKNVLIAIYRPPWHGIRGLMFPPRTHAYFPRDLFDQVEDHLDANGWIFGRSGEGYVALYNSNIHSNDDKSKPKYQWETKGRELLVEGGNAVWICVTGRAKVDGSFDSFVKNILSGAVKIPNAKTFESVSLQLGNGFNANFGWDADFVVQTSSSAAPFKQEFRGFGRLESPFADVKEFPATQITLKSPDGSSEVFLNFDQIVRNVTSTTTAEELSSSSSSSSPPSCTPFAPAPSGSNEITSTLRSAAQLAAQHAIDAMQSSSLFHNAHFASWGYEGGVIQTGLWELAMEDASIKQTVAAPLSALLDNFENTPGQLGYRIAHGEKLMFPYGYSVGDHLGLYPMAFGARVKALGGNMNNNNDNNNTDVKVVELAATEYVAKYPHHLADGTISRPLDWPSEGFLSPGFKGVWVDDSFMGTALISQCLQLGAASCVENKQALEELIVNQQLLFAKHLRDAETGLYFHGYNDGTGHHSCCKWGRGNGWALMAKVEALLALESFNSSTSSSLFNSLLPVFKEHLQALVAQQQLKQGSGLWRNVLDKSDSPTETSVSAMVAYSMAIAIENNWITKEEYGDSLIAVAQGLVSTVCQEDGSISGIIGETMIHSNANAYDHEAGGKAKWSYSGSAPGLGAVFRAMAALLRVLPTL